MMYGRRTAAQRARTRFLFAYAAMFILTGFLVSFFAAIIAASSGHHP